MTTSIINRLLSASSKPVLLALAVFGTLEASAQCVYTTTRDGNFSDPTIYTGGCTTAPLAGSTIIINNNVVLDRNFSSTGSITIGTAGSLIQDGTNRSLTITGGSLTVAASTASRGVPKLAVSVLDVNRTTTTVGANSLVQVSCTVFLGNQSSIALGNNSLLNILGNVDVATGNPGITGPTTGAPAGLRITGNIVNNSGGGSKLFDTAGLISCVQRQPLPGGCVVSSTAVVTPPATNDPSCRTVLPVTLIRFGGSLTSSGGVALSWATASEKNNAYFEVQRSATGEAYQTIGKVAAEGNSSSLREYAFTDARPLAGQAYYRLRQVDLDGTVAFSPVATVRRNAEITIYPNPTANALTLPASLGPVRYRILNGLGQAVASGQSAGGGALDLSALPKGAFFLELTDTAGRHTHRLMRE